MTAEPIADAAPPRRRWIHVLLALVVVGMIVDVAVGVIVHLATGRLPLLPVMAAFLILSGIRLLGVAIDTLQRVRAAPDHAAVARGWGWVVYKLIAAAVAFAGAAYLLLAPDAQRLEGFIG